MVQNKNAGVAKKTKEESVRSLTRRSRKKVSQNETPVNLLEDELKPWIRVLKPSRAALSYERME